jgi:hypothetical protein
MLGSTSFQAYQQTLNRVIPTAPTAAASSLSRPRLLTSAETRELHERWLASRKAQVASTRGAEPVRRPI